MVGVSPEHTNLLDKNLHNRKFANFTFLKDMPRIDTRYLRQYTSWDDMLVHNTKPTTSSTTHMS